MSDCIDHGCKGYIANLDGTITGPSGKVLKPGISGSGYQYINTGQRNYYVHRLVAQQHCQRPAGCDFVNHKDGDKKNNAASNLEWCTREQNMQHAVDNHLHNKAKLAPDIVRYLRTMYVPKCSEWGVTAIATRLGMSKAAIGLMLQGVTWQHVN